MGVIKYSLIRSARRKTMSVTVKSDGSVIVRAPLRTADVRIEKFVLSKNGWISKQLKKVNASSELLSGIQDYSAVLIKGEQVPLMLGEDDSFTLYGVRAKSFRALQKLYVENLGDEFLNTFYETVQANGFKYSSVGFKSYKSRWGCCTCDGKIFFNYKLLMLPKELWRAVIVHELCHTVYMNHSANFYLKVLKVMPDYKSVHNNLKQYNLICSLY